MSEIADLVRLFYQQLWKQKDFGVANQILHEQVSFRGSLGQEMVGLGAAFFESKNGLLTEIWVLGDMQGLNSNLQQNTL